MNEADRQLSNEILFWGVWRNCYLNKIIYYYSSLFKKHNKKVFKNKKDFELYKFKQYVTRLEINFEDLQDVIGLSKYINLKSIKFGDRFYSTIEPGILHEGIESLEFGDGFNSIIKMGTLPLSLKFLKFGSSHNKIVEIANNSVTHLQFGKRYNQPIGKSEDSSKLGNSLTYLHLGNSFNQMLIPYESIPHSASASLKYLHLGTMYNKPLVKGSLPNCGIETLYLGRYNHPLIPNESLPVGSYTTSLLTYLDLGHNFRGELLPYSIPFTVSTLIIRTDIKLPLRYDNSIPSSVKNLHLPHAVLKDKTLVSNHFNLSKLNSLTYSKGYPDSIFKRWR